MIFERGGRKRKACDVLVVGGGLIGCAVAREAALRGARTVVLERGATPAVEATWAAAGMLSPLAEASGPGPFLRLALSSLGRYPEFAARLREETGIDPGLRRTGKLLLALDAADQEPLRRQHAWQAREHAVRAVDAVELARIEPALSARALSGLELPGESLVDNRLLGRAAWAAAERAGVTFLTGRDVRSLSVAGGRVQGVRLVGGETLASPLVILAAGAWSGVVEGLPRPLPVRPVRGQMIALGVDAPVVRRIVSGAGVYLLPRQAAGRHQVWVGATVEEVGFRKRTTAAARDWLHSRARRLVPELAAAPVVDQWAGLRPGTPDNLPVLGPDPEVRGLVYATGHFRNGILLAPATAHLLGRVLDGESPAELSPFRPNRFLAASGRLL